MLVTIGEVTLGLVWADGAVNWYTILIVAFLFQLGIITALVMMSGGATAFTEWATQRIKTRRGAKTLTGLLGMIIFIEDYLRARRRPGGAAYHRPLANLTCLRGVLY